MFTVTQLNGTVDNNLHIPSDSAVPVLCCCTAVLLHQMSVLATSLRSVDRTNVASSTDCPLPGRLVGGSYRPYLSVKIMSMFPQCRQLIQHTLWHRLLWCWELCGISGCYCLYRKGVVLCCVVSWHSVCRNLWPIQTHNMISQYKQQPVASHCLLSLLSRTPQCH